MEAFTIESIDLELIPNKFDNSTSTSVTAELAGRTLAPSTMVQRHERVCVRVPYINQSRSQH